MEYTITLADGRKLTNLRLNGNNYVSEIEVDENIFKGNLDIMTVSDGETEITYRNVVLVQQTKYPEGYYLYFRELSAEELEVT